MNNVPAVQKSGDLDLFKESVNHCIAVLFPKTRAAGYTAAVNLAMQGVKYGEGDVDGKLYHSAVFGKSKEQIGRALALYRHLSGVKSVQYFVGGQIITQTHRIQDVLSCLIDAEACNDHRAHCQKVITDPFSDNGESLGFSNYLLPCTYLERFGRVILSRKHPSSPTDQVQALAVKRGCEWCPNFNANDFKKI